MVPEKIINIGRKLESWNLFNNQRTMANRPVFIPSNDLNHPVLVENIEFDWYAGMAISQKQRSIQSLHENAKETIGFLWIGMEMVRESTDSYGFPCIPMYCYGFLSIPMDSYGFLSFPMVSYGFLRFPILSYEFLWIPMNSYGFLCIPMESLRIP